MSTIRHRSHRVRLLALFVLTGLAAYAPAQGPPAPQSSASCLPSASRARESCEPTKVVVRTETQLSVSLELPSTQTASCAATVEIEYSQHDTQASVEGTLDHRVCAASSGEYRIDVRVRNEAGEIKTLEFVELWQRVDDQPVRISARYPIGENVDLLSMRSRQLRCTCNEPVNEAP
jgi:hypothetical protein